MKLFITAVTIEIVNCKEMTNNILQTELFAQIYCQFKYFVQKGLLQLKIYFFNPQRPTTFFHFMPAKMNERSPTQPISIQTKKLFFFLHKI